MAYRSPRFSHVHAARKKGATQILISDTAHADFPKENMIDNRNTGTFFKWSASVTDPTITVDLGDERVADDISSLSRLIIPPNHNILSLYIQDDDNSGMSSPTDLHASVGAPDTSPTAGQLIDIEFDTADSTQRYIRLSIVGTATFQVPQLVFTKIFAPTIGPNLGEAIDEFRDNISRHQQPTGLSPTVKLGPQQRFLEYEWEPPISGADLTGMENFIASVGMEHPFWVDPASFSTPPETDEPALAMKFERMPRVRNSVVVPLSEARAKTFSFSLIESLD